jgi:hypothetical protein
MKRLTLLMICVLTFIGIDLMDSLAMADEDKKISVSVAFGRGLNTVRPPGDPMAFVNHAILPDDIKVKEDGVVNFLVAGFHQIVVYNRGTKVEDILVPRTGTFINDPATFDPTTQFYLGINPAGGPLATPVNPNPTNVQNRLESVSFAEPGTYLVICNIRGHFLDGMFAFVKVKKDKD